MSMARIKLLLVVILWMGITHHHHHTEAYSINNKKPTPYNNHEAETINRRAWLQQQVSILGSSLVVFASTWSSLPTTSCAKSPPLSPTQNPLESIKESQATLDKLLSNWKRATIDCTFADVPRELLETKNKELLLEKASIFALFDKSVSVETCKTTNRIVRDYLGVTGKGPLVGIDKKLKRGLDFVSPDDVEDYVAALESFSQSLSKASSLSYTAGVADFDAVNNFPKDAVDDTNENSNLEQAKLAISQAKDNLDLIVKYLEAGSA
ncbi:unnamed protein product [Cylindrotheca closterium]|uniref:Uncharacterized protein n=1 Tax=Cylindrotheca closterium TaxID=2856 RepID=A0AAD2FLI6_9STRA|nr:unnamed protein product [Cylindrotheca closterium]